MRQIFAQSWKRVYARMIFSRTLAAPLLLVNNLIFRVHLIFAHLRLSAKSAKIWCARKKGVLQYSHAYQIFQPNGNSSYSDINQSDWLKTLFYTLYPHILTFQLNKHWWSRFFSTFFSHTFPVTYVKSESYFVYFSFLKKRRGGCTKPYQEKKLSVEKTTCLISEGRCTKKHFLWKKNPFNWWRGAHKSTIKLLDRA